MDGLRAQQSPAARSLGSLQANGEVYINSSRAAGAQTVFAGDTVRTGADGAAALTAADFGLMTIASQSQFDFRAAPFLGTLRQGSVGFRTVPPGQNFEIQFGATILYLPSPEAEAVADITVAPDGSARVECRGGSVGLRSVQGVQLLVLNASFAVEVGADGKVQQVEPINPASGQNSSGPTAGAHVSRRYIFWIAVGGGGAAAVAAILLTRKSSPPVSPASP